jgi:hypothetical protein
MNLKTHFKKAWNEPRRFFLCLFLLCGVCLGLFLLRTYPPRFGSSAVMPSILVWAVGFWILGILVGVFGFVISWIPPFRRLLTWIFRRRFFVLACVITLVALFYAEENWRGKHAWQKYKREQEAKGEQFDLQKITPPPVPDNQNFFMAQIIVESISAQLTNSPRARDWYGKKIAEAGHSNLVNRLEMPIELEGRDLSFTNKSAGWQNAEPFDLRLWQEYYRKLATITNVFPVGSQAQTPAEDVLLALSRYDSNIEELRLASRRPYSRFPVGYTDENPITILLPHLAVLKACTTPLQLRAVAELQAGHSEKALDDIELMFRLTEAIRNEPIIISHLVRIAMLQITLQPVWEGLAAHHWNNEQLTTLDAELSKLDFLADYSFSMRGERAFGLRIIDYNSRNRGEIQNLGEPENAEQVEVNSIDEILSPLINRAIPNGWFQQNKLAIAQMHERYLLPQVDVEKRGVSLDAHERASQVLSNTKMTPYNSFTKMLLPALSLVSQKTARAQSSTDLARIAIALERYRLAHETFPETLNVLAPQFLGKIPHDIINGQSLHYRRTKDGQFVLYSVGWNGTDDGGTVVLKKGKTPSVDIKQGDWVWKYPAN